LVPRYDILNKPMIIKKILLFLVLLSIGLIARADANPDLWPYVKRECLKIGLSLK